VKGRSFPIKKGSRHSKILGDFGEFYVCNWLSRSGFEVARVDYTGLDLIAYHPKKKMRIGISVKSRMRRVGKENEDVNLFQDDSRKNKFEKMCQAFNCEPWIAIYDEYRDAADLYLTSLDNYYEKYYSGSKKISWSMSNVMKDKYDNDSKIMHIRIDFKQKMGFSLRGP
jgi:Holliday junction resolvase-like predicted endonuclease